MVAGDQHVPRQAVRVVEPSRNLQRVFAIVELLRAVAAFMIAPVFAHLAATVGGNPQSGTGIALWIGFGLAIGGGVIAVLLYALGPARPHPRAWGTFPRFLGHYVRDTGVLGLEDCVAHLTGRPARRAARLHRVVRDGIASFFFHPIYELNTLREIVEGIRAEGFTFVSPDALQ